MAQQQRGKRTSNTGPVRLDKTIKGGRSLLNGVLVNAWGDPIDEDGNVLEGTGGASEEGNDGGTGSASE